MTFGNIFFFITEEIEKAHWRHVLRNYDFVFADDMEDNTSENCKAMS